MNSFYFQKLLGRGFFQLLLIVFLTIGCTACGSDSLVERRNSYLEKHDEDEPVRLAVIWSHLFGDYYYRGVQMAAEELNAAGGIAGHKVEPFLIDRYTNVKEGRNAVYQLNEAMDAAFALGLYKSEIAKPLIQLLQYYGLPMLINANVSEILQAQWTGGVFRGTLTTRDIGKAIYEECLSKDVENVILCYSSETYPQSIADAMIGLLRDNTTLNAQIYRVDALTSEWRHKLSAATENDEFRGQKTATVILMNVMNDISQFESLLADLVEKGDIDMAFTSFIDIPPGKKLSDRLGIPLFVISDMLDAESQALARRAGPDSFVRRFQEKNGRLPNGKTVYGYEQTMAVANAMKKAGSIAPVRVIEAMRNTSYKGLIQTYDYADSGELKQPHFFKYTFRSGEVTETLH